MFLLAYPYKKPYVIQLTDEQINKIRRDVLESTTLNELLDVLLTKALREDAFLFQVIGNSISAIKEREENEKKTNLEGIFTEY